ncbi:uncharacterized protein LOC116626515 [Phoca vitulina]|uniref:uncharacterized protein LOC116626515 n=1 Tax=Phoca vitulina TaxID=9720 RepID=UPI001395D3A9|nr:uncharacterized protein LOC116626515 [Phoca vitulina]
MDYINKFPYSLASHWIWPVDSSGRPGSFSATNNFFRAEKTSSHASLPRWCMEKRTRLCPPCLCSHAQLDPWRPSHKQRRIGALLSDSPSKSMVSRNPHLYLVLGYSWSTVAQKHMILLLTYHQKVNSGLALCHITSSQEEERQPFKVSGGTNTFLLLLLLSVGTGTFGRGLLHRSSKGKIARISPFLLQPEYLLLSKNVGVTITWKADEKCCGFIMCIVHSGENVSLQMPKLPKQKLG